MHFTVDIVRDSVSADGELFVFLPLVERDDFELVEILEVTLRLGGLPELVAHLGLSLQRLDEVQHSYPPLSPLDLHVPIHFHLHVVVSVL